MAPLAVLAIALPLAAAQATAPPERVIAADLKRVKGPLDTMFKACVGAGRANEALRADWQRQLAYVHKECGFTYLRMHGLLGDDMGVYREDKAGRPEYNWQYIDEAFDFLPIGRQGLVRMAPLGCFRQGQELCCATAVTAHDLPSFSKEFLQHQNFEQEFPGLRPPCFASGLVEFGTQ